MAIPSTEKNCWHAGPSPERTRPRRAEGERREPKVGCSWGGVGWLVGWLVGCFLGGWVGEWVSGGGFRPFIFFESFFANTKPDRISEVNFQRLAFYRGESSPVSSFLKIS